MSNIIEKKFSDCDGCFFFRSRQCRSCDSGEYFEPRVHEINLEGRNPKPADHARLDPNSGENDE